MDRNTEELMAMLGPEESLDMLAKASSMRWCGHVLRRKENNVLLKALQFELLSRIGRERLETKVETTSRKGNE